MHLLMQSRKTGVTPRKQFQIIEVRVSRVNGYSADAGADGNYEVSFLSNVNVESNGDVTWVPPAIYKSSCRIDVEYFPFDEQTCVLIFGIPFSCLLFTHQQSACTFMVGQLTRNDASISGSWTYDSSEVQLSWYNNKEYVELNDYSYSGIWDVMDVPGQLAQNASKVVFHIVIRRFLLFIASLSFWQQNFCSQ
ncbi:unnamed protein product [Toxocara canis]|uniref:Neur_chan_LBD domain-containing protein n=1 Tax=Toxocara canis TaxID=6265 RepID=A0A183VF49_TOXCA|nr:unnamed protein product [Toxocara canis]